MTTHYHMKGEAPGLALKKEAKGKSEIGKSIAQRSSLISFRSCYDKIYNGCFQ